MRALTSYLAFTSSFFGQDTKSGTEIVKSNLPFSRPYEPICYDHTFATYDQSEPDDWCYETSNDYLSEQHPVYLEHLESNQIYTCNSYEVQKLVDQGVDLNSVEYEGFPILYHAVKNGYSSIVKMLLNAGASSDFIRPNSSDLLNSSAEQRHLYIKAAKKGGYSENILLKEGAGLLHITALNGHYFTTKELILAHPSTQKPNPLIELFIYSNRVNQIKQMVDVKDSHGTTPLIIAADLGHKDIVKILIDFRADKNHIDGNGWSARTIVDHHLLKKDESETLNYRDIVNLFDNYTGELTYYVPNYESLKRYLITAYLGLYLWFNLYRLFKGNKVSTNEKLDQIKERGPLSAEEIELLKEKLPFVCAISHEELTSSDEIYCVEDIKTLYEKTALVSWITRTEKFSDDRNDITFINPITNQRVSINRVFDATISLHKFLESEEGLDQSQSQAASADEQEADPLAAAANPFAAMVSRQRQMRASGKSL